MIKFNLRRFRSSAALLIGIGAVVIMMNFCGCRQPASLEPKNRPSGVPSDARWVGGADGGAYVRCSVDAAHDVNPCSVWNDYTGKLVESGNYRLTKEGRAAKFSELKVTAPDFGGLIYLQGGLVLKRL